MPAATLLAGIGLRAPHYRALLEQKPRLGFLEVHGENFFGAGGQALAWLERFRAEYPLSIHGVGLSLGSTDPLDEGHLAKLEALVRRTQPLLVSEHLSWSSHAGRHANDLLPLPYTPEAVAHVAERIEAVQERLGRTLLVENVSAYFAWPDDAMSEWEFLDAVARRSGCAVLLDVNNVWVNAVNHGFDPRAYLRGVAPERVGEVHLAGFESTPGGLIDTHGTPVSEEVWRLYGEAVALLGPRPTLVEWDTDIPALEVLLAQAARADTVLAQATSLESAA